MSFREMVGHQRPLSILRRSLLHGRLAHAYLFEGPDGIGKATAAWNFAKAILCASGKDDACESCEACAKVSRGSHPDLLRLEPAGAQFRIDQIRELRRSTFSKPLEGKWRVVLIDRAHDLTEYSGNALLKILEEPPRGNVIVLIARSTASLLPTIISRCQVLHFSPLAPSEIARFLQERQGWDRQEALRAAGQAQGSIKRAELLKEKPLDQAELRLLDAVDKAGEMGPSTVLSISRGLAGERTDMIWKLEFLQRVFRDLVFIRLGFGEVDQKHLADRLERMAGAWSLGELLRAWEWIVALSRGIENNWNVQLAMDEFFLRLKRLRNGAMLAGRRARPPDQRNP